MKKILALMGSPRINKNTNALLDLMLKGVEDKGHEINKIYISKENISPCKGCNYCGNTGECVIKDDMVKIYDYFDNSDIFILASPLYFNSVNGITKNLIDRCQKYWSIKYQLGGDYKRHFKRRGMFLAVGGAKYSHDHFSYAIPTIDLFFKAINAEYVGNYFISGTDHMPIQKREDIRDELYEIGYNIDGIKNFYIHR
ncbi:flavodoxin family protein [Clostridium cochlearium]|uniref:flavodoxin family protein n=1 Tax=Clostridium cochlearium TaxID=1494 RepID=UPI0017C4AD45|nr:flavodoxin family protein [Clostridium cochlearium]NMA58858.1 flavodoxin family protein [Clostridium cochlearium]